MLDRFDRDINYLRISVTDKCNLRCFYCMPEEGIQHREHEEFLSFEQIAEVVRTAVDLGINKIRLTGGEPLVKRGIVELVAMIMGIRGEAGGKVEHLAMTTNGSRLETLAGALRRAGLDSINISLDTLDPLRYRSITRLGELSDTLKGIDAALREGFPIKINMVVFEETDKAEVRRMEEFCNQKGIKLQLINHFSLSEEKGNHYSFDRPPNCSRCNRIRLLADGSLKPCLHSNAEIKLDLKDIKASLVKAVQMKPERGSICLNRNMIEIGG